jgi:hypothetical protein
MGDPLQPPVIYEHLEIPVNRCLVEGRHELAAVCQNLIHAQRPFMMTEDLLYGHSLCGIAPQSLILLFQEVKLFLSLLQAFSQ